MRALFSIGLVGLGLLGSPVLVSAAEQDASRARLLVYLPADARLTIDGEPTKSTSAARLFITPPLEKGQVFHYILQAQLVRGSKTFAVKEKLPIRAGERKIVSLHFPDTTAGNWGAAYGPAASPFGRNVRPLSRQDPVPSGPAGRRGDEDELEFMAGD